MSSERVADIGWNPPRSPAPRSIPGASPGSSRGKLRSEYQVRATKPRSFFGAKNWVGPDGYEGYHPSYTDDLSMDRSALGQTFGFIHAGYFVLDSVL